MFPLIGLSAAALMAGAVAAPMATASSPAGGSSRHTPAAVSLGQHSGGALAAEIARSKGKCHTLFGTWTEDGIISWDSPANGFDAAGAADFTCTKKPSARRTFSTVTVLGIFGDPGTSQFDVTVYGTANGEPDMSNVVCPTQTVTGTPTGNFPDVTVIALSTPCKGNMGTNWLEVQVASDTNSWYWGTQAELGGKYPADWRDTTGAFGTPCTPGYQDGLYMQDCIFGGDNGEPDFMFILE